jgi:hypothetical protein
MNRQRNAGLKKHVKERSTMGKMISILRRAVIVWTFMLLTALPALAALEDDIARDFNPLAGYVVMKENDEFIIDLDASHGICLGDIFAVVGPGKEIVHPVTKKVLGKLETVKGILKVIRLADGYSFARALGDGSAAIKRGDAIRRYALLPAVFWDYSGGGEPLYIKLQQMLPQLKWREYHQTQKQRPSQPGPTAATANALTFIYSRDELVVRDPEFNELRRYPLSAASVPGKPAPQTPVAAAPSSSQPASTAKPPLIKPQYQQVQTIAELPNTALMADFLFIDGNLWLATTDGNIIEIFKLTHALESAGSSRPSTPARILALKWWVPAGAKTPHLAVTIWADKTVGGLIFRLEGNRLSPLSIRIPLILGTFDLDADGLPETLLGQNFNRETFYGEHIAPLELAGGDIRTGSLKMKLPRRFTVIGSLLADLTGDGKIENAFIRNGKLYIFNGKKRIYKSLKKMGGSLSFLTYDVNPGFKDSKPTTAAFEISPVAVDLDADGRRELLASAAERSILGSLKVSAGLTKTWISIFKYDGGRFSSGTLGEEFELALQGITFNERRLLVVTTEMGDLAEEGGKSHLLAYSLAP